MAPRQQQEIALPVAALAALRDSLVAEVGHAAAAEALRAAGHAAGDAFFGMLATAEAQDPAGLPADRFWNRLARAFSARGWGQISYTELHPGVGSLTAAHWAEARTDTPANQPCCHVTTGLLANLLGRVAGADVAVLEVECQGRGDEHCRFLFGGADAVYAVYERLNEGERTEDAVAHIG